MPEIPRPTNQTCSCGADLSWEMRETQTGDQRWLALCKNPECGEITTSPDGMAESSSLQSVLLADSPLRRSLSPWLRFFYKTCGWGYCWDRAPEACWACGDEMNSALSLRWHPARPVDPFLVLLCLRCGSSTLFFWNGQERIVVSLDGEAWTTPATPLVALRKALMERAEASARYQGGEAV